MKKKSSSRCPYAVLNIPRGADDDVIKDAYKRLSRLLHPDKRKPGVERDSAQESFIELTDAYEILGNRTLRQAYDHFGHYGVTKVRDNPHKIDSLFNHLSKLHDDGKPTEALRVLRHVLEDTTRQEGVEELEFSADINVDLHLCGIHEGSGIDRLEVTSTNVSLSAAVPMPRLTNASSPFPSKEDELQDRKQNVKLSIGGQSDIENGLAGSKSVLAATYQPRAETDVISQLVIDRKRMETTLSSTHLLSSGTRMSAKMTRTYNWNSPKAGKLSFGFSSNRVLTMFQGRTVHAMFGFGVGSNLMMQYGVVSLVTWGFHTTDTEDEDEQETHDEDDTDKRTHRDQSSDNNTTENGPNNKKSTKQALPPPQLSAKLVIGSQSPLEMSISQNNLFHSPNRSGDMTLSWGPLTGIGIKGMLNREISTSYITSEHYETEFSSTLGIGLEHTPLSGLKWLLRYDRPDGISIQIPVFLSGVLSHYYLNDVIWYSALSFLVDETVGELTQAQTPENSISRSECNALSDKVATIQVEQLWLSSSTAKFNAEKQMNIMRPIAASKRKRETKCNGLVIIKATYYRQSSSHPAATVDVTDQLQFYVHNSSLVLPTSSKSLLLGFSGEDYQTINSNRSQANVTNAILSWLLNHGDKDEPTGEEPFRLSVRYKFRGSVYETSVGDNETLRIPNKFHLNLGPTSLVS